MHDLREQVWKERVKAEKVRGQLRLSKLKLNFLTNGIPRDQQDDSKFCSSREYLGLIADDHVDELDEKIDEGSGVTESPKSPNYLGQ